MGNSWSGQCGLLGRLVGSGHPIGAPAAFPKPQLVLVLKRGAAQAERKDAPSG